MKKNFFLLISVFFLLMLPSIVTADYGSYYDVINDIKTLLSENPDAAWEVSRDAAKSAASELAGFSCRDSGEDAVICTKSHWSGDFQITLYFSEEKLAAVECDFTAHSIQDLNYQPDAARVQNGDDLINRLKIMGLLPETTAQQENVNLFPDQTITPYKSIFGISADSLLQVGYKAKTSSNPKFTMSFIVSSMDFAPEAVVIEMPAEEETENNTVELTSADFNTASSILKEKNIALDPPKNTAAADENAFLGTWIQCYMQVPGDTSGKIYGMFILDGNFVVVDSSIMSSMMVSSVALQEKNIMYLYISPGNMKYSIPTINYLLDDPTEFIDGKLIWNDTPFNMNDNGMISYQIEDQIQYFCKISDEVLDEENSSSAADSANNNDLSLKVQKNSIQAGDLLKVEVSAPGADRIKIYGGHEYIPDPSGVPFKEGEGETLSYVIGLDTPGTWYMFAVASYGGVWSNQKSNVETITVTERSSKDIIGHWVLSSISEDIYSEKPKSSSKDFRNTSLGLDSIELIFNEDSTFERISILDGKSTVEKGTWSLDNTILQVEISGETDSYDVRSERLYSSMEVGEIVNRLSYTKK